MAIGRVALMAQDDKPVIIYGQPHDYTIGGITIEAANEGTKNYPDQVLINISGLSVGDFIRVPGDDITKAVKKYWQHGLFTSVKIEASQIKGDSIFLNIVLGVRPKVSEVNINGVKKNERDDLAAKIGIVKGSQLTPNMVNTATEIIRRYFDDKGYKNAQVQIVQKDDIAHNDQSEAWSSTPRRCWFPETARPSPSRRRNTNCSCCLPGTPGSPSTEKRSMSGSGKRTFPMAAKPWIFTSNGFAKSWAGRIFCTQSRRSDTAWRESHEVSTKAAAGDGLAVDAELRDRRRAADLTKLSEQSAAGKSKCCFFL